MIDFLLIAGHVVPVAEGSYKENEPTRGSNSSESYSYNGALRTTVRWEKRSWTFTTAHMLKAEGNVIKAAVALGHAVAVTGSAFPAPVTCRVNIGEGTVVTAETEDDNDWVMQYAVTMREV